MMEDLHTRLAGVVIECLPFDQFIQHYDRPTTLFYLDPPYWGSESDYGKHAFKRDDFDVLAACLRALKGRFILSINDVPEIREIFSGFAIEAVTTTYSIQGKGKAPKAAELIISNPP